MQSSLNNISSIGDVRQSFERGEWTVVDDRTTLWRLAGWWGHKVDETFSILSMCVQLMRGAVCEKKEVDKNLNNIIDWINRTLFWLPNTPKYINLHIDKEGDIDFYYSSLRLYAANLNYIYKNVPRFIEMKNMEITLSLSFGVGGVYSPIKSLKYLQDSNRNTVYQFTHLPGVKVKNLITETITEVKRTIDPKSNYQEDEIDAMPLTEYAKKCLKQAGIRTREDAMALLIGLSSAKVHRAVMSELREYFKKEINK